MKFDPDRFERFFRALPVGADEALALARRHDSRLEGRAYLDVTDCPSMRHAVEIRHDSFRCEAFIELLRRYGIGLVVADTVDWPLLMDLTADFVYCRLHGSEQLYVSGYDDTSLDRWANLIRHWAKGEDPQEAQRVSVRSANHDRGRDVYVYFDNDVKVRAPMDAAALAARLPSFSPCR
jgi:uncharacterized protein YecE (DUF72 family)